MNIKSTDYKDPLFITIADLETNDGVLPGQTEDGLPYVYLDEEGQAVCPTCANLMKEGDPLWPIASWFVLVKGIEHCVICNVPIEGKGEN